MTDGFYKGYIRTVHKRPVKAFKGKPLLTLQEAREYPEYAGVLTEKSVVLDFDDSEMAEAVVEMVEAEGVRCARVRTTRGVHLLFWNKRGRVKKCGVRVRLACGLEADVKTGEGAYHVLRYDGEDREASGEVSDEIPAWLVPVYGDAKFWGLKGGDGRNQAMFSHIPRLQSAGLSKEESIEALDLMNRYVLGEPVGDEEFRKITRDEAFVSSQSFFEGRRFCHERFAEHLMARHGITRIDGVLCVYTGKGYAPAWRMLERLMLDEIPTLTASQRREVSGYIEIRAEDDGSSDPRYVVFRNGVLDLGDMTLKDHTQEVKVMNVLGVEYHPEAQSVLLDRIMKRLSCDDEDVESLLEEMAGYTMYRRNELRKAFILIGNKANGKSTYLDMVTTMLGKENVCSLDLAEVGDRFKTAEMAGKLANIGDDIGDTFVPNPAIFKKIVSGDRVNAERKGKDPFDFSPYCKFLFSANAMPRIKDKTGAVMDRLIIIPFDATFSKKDPDYDPYIKYKLREKGVQEALAVRAVRGLQRVLERGFTMPKRVVKEMDEYEASNDSLGGFLKHIGEKGREGVEGRSTEEVYKEYLEYCVLEGAKPMSSTSVTRGINRRLGLAVVRRTVEGKQVKIYTNK